MRRLEQSKTLIITEIGIDFVEQVRSIMSATSLDEMRNISVCSVKY
jgi:hypothetical protein